MKKPTCFSLFFDFRVAIIVHTSLFSCLLDNKHPSIWILYLLDEINNPAITLKAIAHPWMVWKNEFPDFSNIEFDSYTINSDSLKL